MTEVICAYVIGTICGVAIGLWAATRFATACSDSDEAESL